MEDIEDAEYVATEHDRLINAVSKLDKTQHITEPTRNEPTNTNSEFNLIKKTNKINLQNVAKVLESTASLVRISKKLKKSQDVSKILQKPLEKPQAERVKRATGYEETKKKVGRWDSVVARSRTADLVTFPLKEADTRNQPTSVFLSKLTSKSSLEKELEEVDPPTIEEKEDDEEQVYPMSYEEMVEHRQHLAKMRAQQSYRAAKAKRQSKIKSKKYHRVLKKERLKQQLKEFEELQKKDPEEALKKLESIEKARALERHTLRHKSTGKWAKNKLIRAKYDTEVRQQLAEQLAVSRSLTHKTQDTQSTDDEADEDELTHDVTLAQDPMNPWMMKHSNKSNVDAEFDFGYKKYLKGKMIKAKHDSNSDSSDNEETHNINICNDLNVIKQRLKNINKTGESDSVNGDDQANDVVSYEEIKQSIRKEGTLKNPQKGENTLANVAKRLYSSNTAATKQAKRFKAETAIATSNWAVQDLSNSGLIKVKQNNKTKFIDITSAFEKLENNANSKVENKLKKMRKVLSKLEKSSMDKLNENSNDEKCKSNLEYLGFKNQKKKAIIDEELIETSSKSVGETVPEAPERSLKNNFELVKNSKINNENRETTSTDIDPNRFIKVNPKYLNTAISDDANNYDELDDDEQVVPKVNIEEVFEEDDVVASFRQEKEDEINKDKPEDINLTLPGWGSWGGKGVKAPRRKRNRFILKAPPVTERRDENKGDIIIKEYTDPKLSAHKIKEVPFPFNSVKDYEASIRAPLGGTFIPQKAHKQLIRPNVMTRAGTIIEPMDEDELLLKKNLNFRNQKVIKLLAKK